MGQVQPTRRSLRAVHTARTGSSSPIRTFQAWIRLLPWCQPFRHAVMRPSSICCHRRSARSMTHSSRDRVAWSAASSWPRLPELPISVLVASIPSSSAFDVCWVQVESAASVAADGSSSSAGSDRARCARGSGAARTNWSHTGNRRVTTGKSLVLTVCRTWWATGPFSVNPLLTYDQLWRTSCANGRFESFLQWAARRPSSR